MKYIDSIDIIESKRIRKCVKSIQLKDLTVLVGLNGTGKTTLFKTIENMVLFKNGRLYLQKPTDTKIKMKYADAMKTGETLLYSLSYRDMVNPKHDLGMYEEFESGIQDVLGNSQSTGERMKWLLGGIKDIAGVVLIDEMDASFDWVEEKWYFDFLSSCLDRTQIIVATHSPIFMALAKDVFDMTTGRWTTYTRLGKKYGLQEIV